MFKAGWALGKLVCISKCAGGSGQALSGVLALAVGRPERRGQTVCLNSARPQVPRPQVQKPDNVVNTDTAMGRVHGLHCIPLAKVSCKASPDLSCGKTDFSLYGKSGRFFANDVGVGQEACGCFCKPSQYKAKVWSPRVDGDLAGVGLWGDFLQCLPLSQKWDSSLITSSPDDRAEWRPCAPVGLLRPLGPRW